MNGVVVSIDTFKEEMEKRGHQYFIFAPRTKKYIDKEKNIFRLPSIALPKQNYYPIALTPFAPWVDETVKNLNLDIIHCQHLFSMGSLGLKIGRKQHIPVVYTYHTLIAEYNNYFPFFDKVIKNFIISRSKNFCNECDQIITPSEAMKLVLYKYGVRKPIEVIPTGIKTENFKKINSHLFKAKHNISENEKLLLYVGRLAEEKNLKFLFKAFKKVREKHQTRLIIVGGGPQENEYKKLCYDLKINEYVLFTGYLKKEETEQMFGIADMFVFPSITDTQGIVITEAMAAGTPPVAVAKMGPANIISPGKDGLLTDLTLEDFSGKIGYLLKNPSVLKKMSSNALKTAKKYSSENCATKMEKLYHNVLVRSMYANQTDKVYIRSNSETKI
jgi:glycosyltransferase involved in cell wall biosynthesis